MEDWGREKGKVLEGGERNGREGRGETP